MLRTHSDFVFCFVCLFSFTLNCNHKNPKSKSLWVTPSPMGNPTLMIIFYKLNHHVLFLEMLKKGLMSRTQAERSTFMRSPGVINHTENLICGVWFMKWLKTFGSALMDSDWTWIDSCCFRQACRQWEAVWVWNHTLTCCFREPVKRGKQRELCLL